jgi:hypothetical protein
MALSALLGPVVVTLVSHDPSADAAGAKGRPPAVVPLGEGQDIRWSPLAGASFYNLVLLGDGSRALDLWPREPHVHIAAGTLPAGTYLWFVYPARTRGGRAVFGSVVARGRISVPVGQRFAPS